MSRRICVVSGTRADYGLLRPLMRGIAAHPALELLTAVTGSHLEERFGNTADQIEADGFAIQARIPMQLNDDSAPGVTRSLARAVSGFADALAELQPELLLILGDRYEILAAAQAALIARIPVAHIAGGDITEGAFDDAIRHAVSKLSHLHFVTHEAARQRLLQLGEQEEHVFLSGSPGIDELLQTPLLDRAALEESLGFPLRPKNLLVTFHPATLETDDATAQLETLLAALDRLGPDTGLILTGANADTGGQHLNQRLQTYAAERDNAVFEMSLGQQRYYSALRLADAVVGNSSSGLYEAPSFETPTVNIGDRQKGRARAASVLDCAVDADAIEQTLRQALQLDCSGVQNPYGDGMACERILAVLAGDWEPQTLIRKQFVDRFLPPGLRP